MSDWRATIEDLDRTRDAEARQDLALRLLFTVEPTDRALTGWGYGKTLPPLGTEATR